MTIDSANVTQWTHVNDALPELEDWVLVAGYDKTGRAWWDCAERQPRGGGGWEWDNNEDGFRTLAQTIEMWAPVSDPPPSRTRVTGEE